MLLGEPSAEPWASVAVGRRPRLGVPHRARPRPRRAARRYEEACERSRANVAEAAAAGGLDLLSAPHPRRDERFNLRWILLHMLEEIARHNGHADLLREAADGETGE